MHEPCDYFECITLPFYIDILGGEGAFGSVNTDLSETISTLIPTEHIAEAFKKLWSCQTIQIAYKQRSKFQLNDSTEYFMNSTDRVCDENYIATDEDILRVRVRTTRASKTEFVTKGYIYQMIDVGGQRSQRRKWIHHFDNVTAVLFIISISEYDQFMDQDRCVSRMKESMDLFEETLNNRYLCLTPFIIFFNKYDLFLEKVKHKSIMATFHNYNGSPHSAEESLRWLKETYLKADQQHEGKRELYTHTTTATDTDLMQNVLKSAQDTILVNICKDSGLL